MVVAVGGDGTAHEVLNGLMQVPVERRPRFGLLPLGSGNDFAHSLGIQSHPDQAVHQIFSGKSHRIDIGSYRTISDAGNSGGMPLGSVLTPL